MNQIELEPQLGQPCYWAKPSSCAFWEMGLDDYLLLRWNCKEWVCCKRERKDGLLIMSFLSCSLSSLLLYSFFFSLLFLLQFSLFLALVIILLPFMATVTIYAGLIWWDFSILSLLLINYFYLLWAPFQSCPLAPWPLGLHYT